MDQSTAAIEQELPFTAPDRVLDEFLELLAVADDQLTVHFDDDDVAMLDDRETHEALGPGFVLERTIGAAQLQKWLDETLIPALAVESGSGGGVGSRRLPPAPPMAPGVMVPVPPWCWGVFPPAPPGQPTAK